MDAMFGDSDDDGGGPRPRMGLAVMEWQGHWVGAPNGGSTLSGTVDEVELAPFVAAEEDRDNWDRPPVRGLSLPLIGIPHVPLPAFSACTATM